MSIPETAELLGIGRNLAYEAASRDGELAGVASADDSRIEDDSRWTPPVRGADLDHRPDSLRP